MNKSSGRQIIQKTKDKSKTPEKHESKKYTRISNTQSKDESKKSANKSSSPNVRKKAQIHI